MSQDKLISDLIDMLFEAKKTIEFLPVLPGELRKSHLQVLQVIEKLQVLQGEVRVTDISKSFKISSPNITKLVNELEEMSYVSKCASLTDKRVVHVQLTTTGEETLVHYVNNYHEHLERVVEKIGVERCEIAIETMRDLSKEMNEISKQFKGEM